jgi:hypothetical protein
MSFQTPLFIAKTIIRVNINIKQAWRELPRNSEVGDRRYKNY